MFSLRSARAALSLGAIAAVFACDSFEVEEIQVALITVPTLEGGEGFVTAPSATFIQGSGITLSSTSVGQEGCVLRERASSGGILDLESLDAGPSVSAHFAEGPEATLTRTTTDGRISYETPEGSELPFTPGATITFEIPGAVGGFPARIVAAPTAEAFTASDITLPTSTTDNLELTWTGVPDLPGSAMFYSIRYSSPGTVTLDREIACVFRDDGTGVVGATLLSEFRQSAVRQAIAQRARITADRAGAVVTHVTATFEVSVVLTDTP